MTSEEEGWWKVDIGVALVPSEGERHGRWESRRVHVPVKFAYLASSAADYARIRTLNTYNSKTVLHSWVIRTVCVWGERGKDDDE